MNRKTCFLMGVPLFYALWNELVFSLFLQQGFTIHKVLFSLLWGLFLYWMGQLNRDRAFAWRIQTIPAFVTSVIYCAQVSYYTLFETPFYLKSISGAGDTMTDFFSVVVDAVIAVAPAFLIMLAYFVLWTTLYRKVFLTVSYDADRGFRSVLVLTAGIIVTLAAGILDYHGAASPSYMMLYEFVPTESVRTFGMLATEFLDIKYNLLHLQATRPETIHLDMEAIAIDTAEGETVPAEAAENEGAVQPPAQPIILEGGGHEGTDVNDTPYDPDVYNVLPELNFAREMEKEEEERNNDFADMNSWFSSRQPSKKNAYTGMFAGKNLILITAEAFSRFVIDPELTPTLYRLYSEGFQFNHFYTGIWGVSTSDGEFVATTGLIPKAGVWSYTEIADNYMPFAFGNQFRDAGYLTQAFHNHSYTYYNRNLSYPNMGYDFYAKGHGLDITNTWPESDVEMMAQTVPLYTAEDRPFHVYYMTVSGHLEYTWEDNAMSVKHREQLAGTKYEHASEPVQAYVASQLELEEAMTVLLKELEAAGVLEDTVIALSGDHYPYGLTQEEYTELRGAEYDSTFGLYENGFLIWNPEMTAPVVCDTYCSSLDIAPTLSNLFGLPYDSRLFIGTDIFGDVSPIVCLQDRSFITDRIMYDNSNQKITQLTSDPLSETYLGDCINAVKNMFYYSAKIIELDYYGYLYGRLTAAGS